ncbi:MAG: stage III sporulation protein AD [Tissierellia bacterium]|mgnify:FL=1|nr:stage III sporulation protein AD [Tissierellia bacterium]
MEIFKIVSIGIIATLLSVFLRQSNRGDFALLISLVTGLIIFSFILEKLKYIIHTLNQLVRGTNVELAYFSTIIKVIAIAYLVEFGSQISRDAGEDSIANKIELGGKVIMMVLAMPILLTLMDLIIKILP